MEGRVMKQELFQMSLNEVRREKRKRDFFKGTFVRHLLSLLHICHALMFQNIKHILILDKDNPGKC